MEFNPTITPHINLPSNKSLTPKVRNDIKQIIIPKIEIKSITTIASLLPYFANFPPNNAPIKAAIGINDVIQGI